MSKPKSNNRHSKADCLQTPSVAVKDFFVGSRVRVSSTHHLFGDVICTISALPSPDAAIVELEDGARERLLLKHLLPLDKPGKLDEVQEPVLTRFEIIEELSPDEERERHRLENKVEMAFYEAGKALTQIRDRRLYRSTHKTFEQYCKERFGMGRIAAHYKIAAAEVVENLLTNGEQNENNQNLLTNGEQILPNSERQVRPLVNLQPEEQRQAWQQAVDLADGKIPTGKIVKGVVERLKEKSLNFASEYCSVGEIFRLQRLADEDKKYNGWWGIALEVENRLTVKCQVYDRTIEIKQENIKRIDMDKQQLVHQQEIIERVSRLARCNLDPVVWAMLEVLNRQTYHTNVQLKLLETAEQLYGIYDYKN